MAETYSKFSYEVCVRVHFDNGLVVRAGFRWKARDKLVWLTPQTAIGDLTKAVLQAHQIRHTSHPHAALIKKIVVRKGPLYNSAKSNVNVTAFTAKIEEAINTMPPVRELKDLTQRITATLNKVAVIIDKEIMVNQVKMMRIKERPD